MLSEWWIWVLNLHWSIENKHMGVFVSFSACYCHLFVNAAHTSFAVLKYSHMLSKLPSGCIHSAAEALTCFAWKRTEILVCQGLCSDNCEFIFTVHGVEKTPVTVYCLPFLAAVKGRFEQLNITAKISQEYLAVAQKEHEYFHSERAALQIYCGYVL